MALRSFCVKKGSRYRAIQRWVMRVACARPSLTWRRCYEASSETAHRGKDITLAPDCAASEFYKDGQSNYQVKAKSTQPTDFDFLAELCDQYPIISIGDGGMIWLEGGNIKLRKQSDQLVRISPAKPVPKRVY